MCTLLRVRTLARERGADGLMEGYGLSEGGLDCRRRGSRELYEALLGAGSPCSVGRKHVGKSDSGGSGLRRNGGLRRLQWKV